MGDALKKQKITTSQVWFAVFYVSEAVHLCKIHIFAVVKDSCFVQKLLDFFKLTTISPSVEKASKIFPER